MDSHNIDPSVVKGFGDEWTLFDQSGFTGPEFERTFSAYFDVFPWHQLPANAEGFDLGTGSGRWARGVAPRVGLLHCIEPSSALKVADRNLRHLDNVRLHKADVDSIPLADNSQDFGYSLGVLHHIPDTQRGIASCVDKLKSGAPFLIYLYYAFDNRPHWFRALWKLSDVIRRPVARVPFVMRLVISQMIAAAVYLPLARTARLGEMAGLNTDAFPLSAYARASFYTMRTDALDRFGTRLEQRFTKKQIHQMMESAGLRDIVFSDAVPYWCAVGFKK